MPAGGLFSTAADVASFCRMVLAEGEFEGKRILSAKSVKEMTRKQTGDLPQSYGLGWSTPARLGGAFGHGGAFSTNMTIDPARQLVLVLLMHHAGFPGKDGGKILPTFHKAAQDRFGK
jgi:CubicO group peptidase (beta-lactamase class C family)